MGPPIFIGGNKGLLILLELNIVGFNGAADFHRRKLAPQWVFSRVCLASMGPPIFIGGNKKFFQIGIIIFHLLQWGRRFSSAEILNN